MNYCLYRPLWAIYTIIVGKPRLSHPKAQIDRLPADSLTHPTTSVATMSRTVPGAGPQLKTKKTKNAVPVASTKETLHSQAAANNASADKAASGRPDKESVSDIRFQLGGRRRYLMCCCAGSAMERQVAIHDKEIATLQAQMVRSAGTTRSLALLNRLTAMHRMHWRPKLLVTTRNPIQPTNKETSLEAKWMNWGMLKLVTKTAVKVL